MKTDTPLHRNYVLNEREISEGKTVLESLPQSLIVSLTTRCNLRCVMCDLWHDPWDMPEAVVQEIRALLPTLRQVIWQGGEVFLSPGFADLFQLAAAHEGLRQVIVTNGLLIDDAWARRLADAGAHVIVSVDGFTPAVYEHIRQGARFSDLEAVFDRLRAAADGSRLQLTVQTVLGPENYRDLAHAADFFRRHGIARLHLLPLRPGPDEGPVFMKGLLTDPSVVAFLTAELSGLQSYLSSVNGELVNTIPLPRPAGNTPPPPAASTPPAPRGPRCRWPWQQLIIDRTGEVRVHCHCEEKLADLGPAASLRSLWNGERMQRMRAAMRSGTFDPGCALRCVNGTIPLRELAFQDGADEADSHA